MKQIILLLFISIGFSSFAQGDEGKIKKTIQTFFDAFTAGDTSMMKSVMDVNMSLQTVDDKTKNTGIKNEDIRAFIKLIGSKHEGKWIEKIESYTIRIDGKYASCWSDYSFYIDTTFSHCGTDNFQLYKKGNNWYIFAITDTRRGKEACKNKQPGQKVNLTAKAKQEINNDINNLLNNWHKAAATANEKVFFGSIAESGVYLGTDKTEYWTKAAFEKWAMKYFEKDKAWDFSPRDRHIYYSDDYTYAWFDELLDTWMGVCRGSGVLKYTESGGWKLEHYNLAVTIPNEKIKEFIEINK